MRQGVARTRKCTRDLGQVVAFELRADAGRSERPVRDREARRTRDCDRCEERERGDARSSAARHQPIRPHGHQDECEEQGRQEVAVARRFDDAVVTAESEVGESVSERRERDVDDERDELRRFESSQLFRGAQRRGEELPRERSEARQDAGDRREVRDADGDEEQRSEPFAFEPGVGLEDARSRERRSEILRHALEDVAAAAARCRAELRVEEAEPASAGRRVDGEEWREAQRKTGEQDGQVRQGFPGPAQTRVHAEQDPDRDQRTQEHEQRESRGERVGEEAALRLPRAGEPTVGEEDRHAGEEQVLEVVPRVDQRVLRQRRRSDRDEERSEVRRAPRHVRVEQLPHDDEHAES